MIDDHNLKWLQSKEKVGSGHCQGLKGKPEWNAIQLAPETSLFIFSW